LALAFLSAAHRFFVAATIRTRPSGLRRRFFLGASSRANAAVLSKPGGPVMRTRTP
jgi:hypothetical protein